MTVRNWSENIEFSSGRLHRPRSVEELQEIVRNSSKVRALGARHSFNDAAAIDDQSGPAAGRAAADRAARDSWAYVSLERLDREIAFDPAGGSVTCGAGITYAELCQRMHSQGVALHNMASLPHISVAGACATGTHGSGDGNGNLSTAVIGMEMVMADGELRSITREDDGELFNGAVVGLGGAGVAASVTLATEPAYAMQQWVYEDLPFAELYGNFDAIMSAAYSVSLFPDWQDGTVNQVWLKHRMGAWDGEGGRAGREGRSVAGESSFFGAAPAARQTHPVAGLPAEPLTAQMGAIGPWHERLPHFRVDQTPASGDELQTEYFVPRERAVAALQAVERLRDLFRPLLWISEVRSVAADRLWMSQSYGTPSIGIHFSWRKDWEAVRRVLPIVEGALAPFAVRPHWGKLFAFSPSQARANFPKAEAFKEMLLDLDPEGKFRNAYLERYLWG